MRYSWRAIQRESLYRALSPKGNPRWSTLAAVIRAIGLKLTVETERPSEKSRAIS
jgi:probable addiction module antidote protein